MAVGEPCVSLEEFRKNTNLGGANIDKRLVECCIREFKEVMNIDLSNDLKARRQLLRECERAKILLSEQEKVEVRVNNIVRDEDLV